MRPRLAKVPGLVVLDGPTVDPMRLVLVLPGTGADGNAVEADLLAAGMPVEMADRDTVVAMVTLADTPERLVDLAVALAESVDRHRGPPRRSSPPGSGRSTRSPSSPREAFFATARERAGRPAVGRVSAELVAPYPPGIPVLAPAEEVTLDAVEALRAARGPAARIAYAADPSVRTLDVIAE